MNKRMLVNAALCNLVNGEDIQESAQTIIEFACTLKTGRVWFEANILGKGGNNVTGATERGSVTIQDDKEKSKVYKLGNDDERIGQFKLMRVKKDEVHFRHYWISHASSILNVDDVDRYVLQFDPVSKTLKYLGVRVLARDYRIGSFIRFHVFVLLPIVGRRAKFDWYNIVLTNKM